MLLLSHLLSARVCVLLAVPKDIDDYVHRIGRTGRAVSHTFSCCVVVLWSLSDDCGLCQGNTGHATAFVNDRNYNICRCVRPEICLVLPQLPWLRRWVLSGRDLMNTLKDANQDVPKWLQSMPTAGGGG